MIVFSLCDDGYYKRFGEALAASARANGLKTYIVKTGETVDSEASCIRHSVLRYMMLPDVIKEHHEVLMLDTDTIIRKPISFLSSWEAAFLVRPELGIDNNKKVNGSCVYLTRSALDIAVALQERIAGMKQQRWYDDQVALYKVFKRDREFSGKSRIRVFDPSFVSWRMAPEASIWTGKGKAKSNPAFLAEVEKLRGECHGIEA